MNLSHLISSRVLVARFPRMESSTLDSLALPSFVEDLAVACTTNEQYIWVSVAAASFTVQKAKISFETFAVFIVSTACEGHFSTTKLRCPAQPSPRGGSQVLAKIQSFTLFDLSHPCSDGRKSSCPIAVQETTRGCPTKAVTLKVFLVTNNGSTKILEAQVRKSLLWHDS